MKKKMKNFKTQRHFPLISVNRIFKSNLLFPPLIVTSLLLLFHGAQADNVKSVTDFRIGALIDSDSRIGKEEKAAFEIAVGKFNANNSRNHKLSVYFQDPGRESFKAALAADELIKKKKVKVIIVGLDSWEKAALVADIGTQAQIPIISFVAPAIRPPLAATRWPFLIRMAGDGVEQIRCISALIQAYNWRRVVVIFEDDSYGGDSGNLALLSENLQKVGSQIEYNLILPPFSSLSYPKRFIQEKLRKLRTEIQSRVFILLKLSSPMTIHLFREAKEMELVGKNTAWILSDTITSYLDSFNDSVISSMEGALGIKVNYLEETSSHSKFYAQFREVFKSEYPGEDVFKPGIHALRAYDSIKAIELAMTRGGSNLSSQKLFLRNIVSSNFNGLSGKIRFKAGDLNQTQSLRIVNVVGKRYKEIDFWLPAKFGFSKSPSDGANDGETAKGLAGIVIWPGDSRDDPKGWAMPTSEKPMKIVVPVRTSFEEFVEFQSGEKPTGFCIDLFYEVLRSLDYDLPYEFFSHNGSYDDLILHVSNKTYDAAVGDITILDKRMEHVEFTQPFAESGLSMIAPARSDSEWIFMRPFTLEMWAATGILFIYTMFIVWFLEHRSNPEFRGAWKNQISTALWFTFSSLFFAHRERVNSNFTRVVVLMWLFLVFILTASYTASLSSLLTVKELESNLDIESVRQKGLVVGCDNDSFLKNYLKNVLGLKEEQFRILGNESSYVEEFKNKRIDAAFLEAPYEKVFLNKYCNGYASISPTYRFGGFGFAFQKGSPIATDFSRAILKLSENGNLTLLENKRFSSSAECNAANTKIESLSLHSFWGIYALSGATSTLSFLFFLLRLLKNYQRRQEAVPNGNVSPGKDGAWNKTVGLAKYFYKGESDIGRSFRGSSTYARSPGLYRKSSSKWDPVSHADTQKDQPDSSSGAKIEML